MAHIINTAKTLHNSYFDGDKYDMSFNSNAPMEVHPQIADRYDYATTENQDALTDRKDSLDLLYEIFKKSPYADGRFKSNENENDQLIKIPKDAIAEVFNYTKDELLKIKQFSPMELIIVINEFYDFNYEYIYKNVLTPKMKQELLDDLYHNEDMKKRMNQGASIKLF